jgi:hypothetical protein
MCFECFSAVITDPHSFTHSDPAILYSNCDSVGPRTFVNTPSHLPSKSSSTINPSIAKASGSTRPRIVCVLIYILHTSYVHRARTLRLPRLLDNEMTTRRPPLAHMLHYYFSQCRRCGVLERSAIEMVGTAHTCVLPVVLVQILIFAKLLYMVITGANQLNFWATPLRATPRACVALNQWQISAPPTYAEGKDPCHRLLLHSHRILTTILTIVSSPRPRVSSQPTPLRPCQYSYTSPSSPPIFRPRPHPHRPRH